MNNKFSAAAKPPPPLSSRCPQQRARPHQRPILVGVACACAVAFCTTSLSLPARRRGADVDAHYRNFYLPQLLPVPSAPAFRFLPPHAQWLKEVDTEVYARCGAHKCVYESTKNRHRRPSPAGDDDAIRYGYILSQPSRVNSYRPKFEEVRLAWEMAQQLSSTYGIRHLLLAEPWEVELTEARAGELNDGPWGGELQKRGNGSGRRREKYFATGAVLWDKGRQANYTIPLLTIQPVQIVPKDSILFSCPERKLKDMIKEQARAEKSPRKARIPPVNFSSVHV